MQFFNLKKDHFSEKTSDFKYINFRGICLYTDTNQLTEVQSKF